MNGAQVLFLPGAAGAGAFWTPIVERLPKACRAEALDLPGLGSVPARADVAGYDDLVRYVARKIHAPTTLIAQSMGAYIAIELALRSARRHGSRTRSSDGRRRHADAWSGRVAR